MDHIGKKLLDVARDELGYTERNTGYTKFGDWYGKHIDKDSYFKHAPWCDMFLAWAADKAGVPDSAGQFASTVDHAHWFKKKDAWGKKPEAGAIVFFDWSGSNSIDMIDHVGIVERVDGGKIHTIEANVDGSHLKRKVRTEDSIAGYGYPGKVKVAAPKPVAATVAAPAAAVPAAAVPAAAAAVPTAAEAALAANAATGATAGYLPRHSAPAPTLTELLSEGAGEAAGRTTGTTANGGKPDSAPVPQEAALSGMLGIILLGTVALAAGKARTSRIPMPAIPALASPVRVRRRGRHHRSGPPVELPADITPADLELADAGTIMMPAISAAVAAQAEDQEFWGRIEHFKEDEELAFWDSLHDAAVQSAFAEAEPALGRS